MISPGFPAGILDWHAVLCQQLCTTGAYKCEQMLNLRSVRIRLVFFCFKGSVCISVCFCVTPDHSDFVLLVSFVVFFQYRPKTLAGKNVSKMTSVLYRAGV